MSKLTALQTGVMVLILCGIVIGVGMIVSHQIAETSITEGATVTWTNANNDSAQDLAGGIRTSTFNVTNGTTEVASGNYTLTATTGSIILTDGGMVDYGNESLTITYDYGEDEAAYLAMNTTDATIGDFVDWFPIIVIALITALLIGLTIRIFSRGDKL